MPYLNRHLEEKKKFVHILSQFIREKFLKMIRLK
nr:MAG TPA: hypothetical protein [Ackermannviridae sp.]